MKRTCGVAGAPSQRSRGTPARPARPLHSRSMDRTSCALAALSAAISVAAGAFGAHGLRARLSPDLLAIFETAARYEMYHAFGLALAAWAATRFPGAAVGWAGWLFVAGTVIF